MVSKDNVLEIETICSCGYGDKENALKKYFENVCPTCGKQGSLQAETLDNHEIDDEVEEVPVQIDDAVTDGEDNKKKTEPAKVVCKECGAEYCGQDGYDLYGGTRGGLSSVNPEDITDEEEEVSEEEEPDKTYMSGWEGLCDLLKPLDGMAMMLQRGDYFIVRKIDMPNSAKLWAYEGINVVDSSVSITDYTPEIYNTFVIKWGESYENELEFVFKKHKQLFGERKTVLEAKKYDYSSDGEHKDDDKDKDSKSDSDIVDTSSSSKSKDSKKSSNPKSSISDLIFGSSDNDKDKSSSSSSTKKKKKSGNSDGSEEDGEDSESSEEVPITTKEEAIQFGLTEVGKAKRDDGHTIQLKVIGNQNWMMGEWCHVKLPSFNEDGYMFISKCSFESGADEEYINTLTLVDYPPSLGRPNKNSSSDSSEEEETENTENLENSENSENGENGSTDGSSSSTSGSSSNS